jgi:hypothetical protein
MKAIVLSALLLLLGAGRAEAQPCVQPDEVPEEIFELYALVLGGLIPLDAPACVKLRKGAVSTCHKAVSAAVQCFKSPLSSGTKGRKIGCGDLDGDPYDLCVAVWEDFAAGLELDLEEDGESGHALCEGDFAAGIFSLCVDAP